MNPNKHVHSCNHCHNQHTEYPSSLSFSHCFVVNSHPQICSLAAACLKRCIRWFSLLCGTQRSRAEARSWRPLQPAPAGLPLSPPHPLLKSCAVSLLPLEQHPGHASQSPSEVWDGPVRAQAPLLPLPYVLHVWGCSQA